MSRTTPAHLQRPINFTTGELRLFYMGANATRSELVKDPVSGLWLPGVRLEGARTNLCLQSQTLQTAPWATYGAEVVTPDGYPDPLGTTLSDYITEVAVSQIHGINQTSVTPAGACSASVWLQAVDRPWVKVMFKDGATFIYGWFDLVNGVVGSYGGGGSYASHWMEPAAFGPGIWRCVVTGLSSALAPFYALPAATDLGAGNNYLGVAGTKPFALFGAQVEAGSYPSSYIPTAAGTVERTADSPLIHESGLVDGTYQATGLLPVILPAHAPAADTAIYKIYDAANPATDHITLSAKATTGVLRVTSAASGGSAGDVEGTVNIADGNLHWIAASIKPGQLACWTDSAPGTVDSAVDVSDVLDSCAYQPCGGWMGGVHVWPRFMNRSPRPVQPLLVVP